MIAIKTTDITQDFKRIANLIMGGEKVLVSRPKNENLVLITEAEYNELDRLRQNAAYLSMLNKSRQELTEGKTVSYSMEQLEEMAK